MNQWRGFADAMRVHGFRRLESMAIGNAGIAAQRAGALEEALEWLERADRMHDECQQTSHRAITQSHIGEVYLALGNRAAGIAAIEQSILLLGQGRPRDRMEAWDALAVAHEAHGDAKQALAALKEARSIERQLHDEEAHIAAAKREQREEFSRIVEEWSRVADQDALSGLPNRRAFDRRMAEMLSVASAAAPCSLILFDLDHFKRINDTYGHATGDAVIKRFAQLLAADRRNGDLPARIGGEEFALLLDATPVEAHRVAERIRACVESEPWSIVQAGLNVTVSAGVVCSLQATSPAQAFERADQCLYRAKHGGRNRVFVEGGDDGVTPIL
jgi:diguanylate cyclase (GGDEF)-like protein